MSGRRLGPLAAIVIGAGILLAASPDVARADVAPGIERAYTEGIQRRLTERGYHPGPIDGIPGAQTRAAIRQYQRDAGINVDGRPTQSLLDHLKFVQPKVYARGPSRELVTAVQQELAKRDYYEEEDIDGLYGPKTARAIRSFQEDARMPMTGIVDDRLLGELQIARDDIEAD